MKSELPESTRQALHYLLQTAATDGVTVAGFAFSLKPAAFANFGNCSDKSEPKLYEMLCQMVKEKQKSGLILADNVQKPV
jgi:hypothetical protein